VVDITMPVCVYLRATLYHTIVCGRCVW